MIDQTVKLVVVDGKRVVQTLDLRAGKPGQPVHLKALAHGKYVLMAGEHGFGPQNITVKRVGKDLHVILEGGSVDDPELVIDGYYETNDEQLIGLGEDGQYHAYVASDAEDSHQIAALLNDVDAAQVLGRDAVAGVPLALLGGAMAGGMNMLGLGVIGLGALGSVGAGLIQGGHGGVKPKPQPLPPAKEVENEVQQPSINQIIDNVGDKTGLVENGHSTDDTRPTLGGKGNPGDTITIIDNGNVIGSTVVDENGNWTFRPEEPLTEGEHKLEVIETDPNGNKSEPSEPIIIIVDTTPPAKPEIGEVIDHVGDKTGPLTNGEATDDNKPTINGKGDPGDTITIIDNGNVIGTTIVDKNGNWTFTPETPLPDGEHKLEVIETDPAGNKSEPSEPIIIIVDTTPPAKLEIGEVIDHVGDKTGPLTNGEATDDNKPTINGKGDPGDTITIIDNGNVIGTTIVDENGNWTFTPETPLPDGEHKLEVIETDPAGNKSDPSEPIIIIVDTTPPAKLEIGEVIDHVGDKTGPLTNGEATDDNKPTINGKGDPGDTITIIDNGNVIGTTVVDENGNWTFTPETPLPDGEHKLEVIETDPAGNKSDPSEPIIIIVDTTPPAKLEIGEVIHHVGDKTGPLTNGEATDDNKPTINGKGDPGDTITIIDNGNVIGTTVVDENGNWTFTPETPLPDGEHKLEVIETDPAGNKSEPSDPIIIIVDTTPPAKPSIDVVTDNVGDKTGPLNRGDVTDDARPVISGKADPGSTVNVYDNGKLIGSTTAGPDGTWTLQPSTPLSNGGHELTVTATDAAGNKSDPSDPFDFTLDAGGVPSAPAITGVIDHVGAITGNIMPNGVTDDARPEIQGTAKPGQTIYVYDNGDKLLGTATVGPDGKWSVIPTEKLTDGQHTITAQAEDTAGNKSVPSGGHPFVVDTVAPDAPSITDVIDAVGQVTGPLHKNDTTDDANPTLSGKAEPGSTVTVYDNGEPIGSTTADKDGNWTLRPAKPLTDGNHNLEVTATDAAGNESEKSAPFPLVVDTSGVAIALNQVVDHVGSVTGALISGQSTDDKRPEITGKATPNGTVTVYVDGQSVGSVVAGADGKWSLTPNVDLTEGKHTITATVTTPVSGESAPTAGFELVIDTTAPSQPHIGDILDNVGDKQGSIPDGNSTDDTTPVLVGKGEPGDLITIIDNGNPIGSVVVDGSGEWSFKPTTPLPDGPHKFEVTETDPAGNVSEKSKPWLVIVDTVQPAKPEGVEVIDNVGDKTGPVGNGESTDDNTPTLNGKGDPGDTITIIDNGEILGTTVVDENGNWTFTPGTGLPDGEHKLEVIETDPAGNESDPSDPIIIIVDTTPPAKPSIDVVTDNVGDKTGPLNRGDVTDDAHPVISGKAEAGSTVKVYDSGELIGSTTADRDGTWTLQPSEPLSNGGHELTVTATDKAGNVSPESTPPFNFTLDAGGAVLPVIIEVMDAVGSVTGPLKDGATTDDTKPTLSGTGKVGATVSVFDGKTLVGSAIVDGNGQWTVYPSDPLADGPHTLSVQQEDLAGNTQSGNSWNLTVESVITTTALIDTIGKDSGLSSTDLLTNDGSAGRLITGHLSRSPQAGDRVQVSTDGGTTWVNATVNANGTWFVTDPNAHGSDWVVQTRVVSASGLSGGLETQAIVLDTTPPSTLTGMDTAWRDNGSMTVTVSLAAGGAKAGDVLMVCAAGKTFQHTLTAADIASGTASLLVPQAQAPVATGLIAYVVDQAGNASMGVTTATQFYDFEGLSTNGYLKKGDVFDMGGLRITAVTDSPAGVATGVISGDTSGNEKNDTSRLLVSGTARIDLLAGPASSIAFDLGNLQSQGFGPMIVTFFDQNGQQVGKLTLNDDRFEAHRISYATPNGELFYSLTIATGRGVDGVTFDNIQLNGVLSTQAQATTQSVVAGSGDYYGSNSDTVFNVADPSLLGTSGVHGGSGIDTLKLTGAGQVLDVTALNSGGVQKLSGIEVIDITGTGNNTLKLAIDDVLNLGSINAFRADGHVQLMVKGDAGDVVSLSGLAMGGAGTWTGAGTATVDSVSYNVYTNDLTGGEVLVQSGVTVNVAPSAFAMPAEAMQVSTMVEHEPAANGLAPHHGGIDALVFADTHQVLDFSALAGKASAAVIDLSAEHGNTFKLTAGDVLDLGGKDLFVADHATQMLVKGDASTTLELSHVLKDGTDVGPWTQGGTVAMDGASYTVYHNALLNTDALVQQEIHTHLV